MVEYLLTLIFDYLHIVEVVDISLSNCICLLTDLAMTSWQQDSQSGRKQRVVTLTMPLSQSVGPKSTQVTETQVSFLDLPL